MMARFYRGDPVRESGNQRETGNAIGVSGASTKVSFTPWVKRKLGCEFMAESGNGPNNARAWWQRFWEPCIACKDEERIGRIGDGGKWICDPQLVLSKPCSVLSVGSSNEFSFEREMVERFRCTIHIYDHTSNPPTPGVDIPAHLMHLVKFHRTAFDTTVVDEQTTTLSVMVDNLIQAAGTDRVDIFKIDCEGCEFSSFQSPENVQIVQKKVVQMQMEIHFGPNSLQQVSNLWFAMVNKFGMVPFHKEANIEFPMGGDGLALELAFLNQMYVKHEVRQSPTFRDAFVGGGMTPPEQELLARLYASATSVFEWGMGSSSLIASHAGIERLTAVDSASTWVDKVSGMLAEKNPSYKFWHVDIGPVGMWGRVSTTQVANVKERFPNYSLQVDRVSSPADIYLVDGRFRVACACRALLHGRADSLVLVHDFERPEYHILLTLADKVENEDKLVVLRRKATTADDAILALWEEYKYNQD